ncbi:MAG: HAD family phosphatase [Smithellaceae bacterium]
MIKAIFWDNDGVLVDTEEIFFRANREVLARRGISLRRKQFEDISLTRGESVLKLAENPGTDAYNTLRTDRDALYAALLSGESLVIDGVMDVLNEIAGNYLMGIVTSSGQEHFDIIHSNTGLLSYFQFVLTLKDCMHVKPHPEPYLKALAVSGLAPEECLVIEDSPRGLAAARNAGIRCIVVPGKFTRGSRFEGASQVLDSIRELPALL